MPVYYLVSSVQSRLSNHWVFDGILCKVPPQPHNDIRIFFEQFPLSFACRIQETGSVSLLTQLQTTASIQGIIFAHDSSFGLSHVKEMKDYQLMTGQLDWLLVVFLISCIWIKFVCCKHKEQYALGKIFCFSLSFKKIFFLILQDTCKFESLLTTTVTTTNMGQKLFLVHLLQSLQHISTLLNGSQSLNRLK
jgi:hypothetical protein